MRADCESMKTESTIMIIGLGDLGSVTLELLARTEGVGRLIVATRNQERAEARCNLARLGAMGQGFYPSIRHIPMDLTNPDAVAEAVVREAPNLILSTATMQTWWLPDLLPPEPAKRIKSAGFGVWLPVHLTLTLKLAEALRAADYQGVTLTAPFPDVVNCILGKLDLAPTCGVGNVDEVVPKVRRLAAQHLKQPVESVRVWLVAHHALQKAVFGGNTDAVAPYFLRVEHDGRDVTQEVEADKLLLSPCPLPHGRTVHFLTAGCTVRLIKALLSDEETFLHAPAPGGLPGGYPVIAGHGRVKPAEIDGLPLSEAIAINENSHRYDGIERIEEDGTVIFRAESADILREQLGFSCDRLKPAESQDRAKELIARFHEYARKHGVDLGDHY